MRKSTNRILSLLLCVMMLVTMLPVSAFATESGGSQQFMDSGGTPPQSEGTPLSTGFNSTRKQFWHSYQLCRRKCAPCPPKHLPPTSD